MKNKIRYIKPVIEVISIEIECALANHSARVLGTDDNFQIHEDWIDEPTVERTIDW
ncbi:MAG: hypothetical protein ACI35V_02930 [Sphingobacterium composti]|uniref:hypothetical protein n=1 Tax=Sphingobacterium composti TaxID=363260 RepID=UPI00135C5058|nr:hypothetical protein [Sphingobacterium composti Ten et al. 2007 non Yoo et al. 2007]